MSALTQAQIGQLAAQGCGAADWSQVQVADDGTLARLRDVQFIGAVSIGPQSGTVDVDGAPVLCGVYHATLADCAVGANVRIANLGSVIARCDVRDGAVIQDVAAITMEAGSAFGAGTEVEVVNEGGGRVVRLVPSLSAQTGYLQAFRSQSPALTGALGKLIDADVAAARTPRASIGAGARILHCGVLRNVTVGAHAVVRGAALLENGTVLSCAEHPTTVGEAVQARHFVIAEGASVTGGAIIDKAFVGQACKIGKQFSAENSLFFANCEAFHGEAVSIFGGPYTVTHHKSTLLIAAGFSFYNAGSGTNQSNHMYKLGPVHQGVFERGSKTGSFAYVLHETHVGPFSVIIGKHYTNINTPDLPFSYIHETDGRSEVVPGMNLYSVGTVRDGEKWPKRDGRKAPAKRDLITFDVFSPFTVEKMRRGRAELLRLHDATPKDKAAVAYGGVYIKRLLLRNGAKSYSQAIIRYLGAKVLARIESAGGGDWNDVQRSLASTSTLQDPLDWTDVGGLLMPAERLRSAESDIVSGAVDSLAALNARLAEVAAAYAADEWAYVCAAFAAEYGYAPSAMTRDQALQLLSDYDTAARALHGKILDDSKKEFDAFAKIGYGLGMTAEERDAEFAAVRGSAATNGVVQKLVHEQEALAGRYLQLKALLEGCRV